MSSLPTQRPPPSTLRHADTPAATRDRRAELGRADEARAEQRRHDDARNDPSAGKWRYRPPGREEIALEAVRSPTKKARTAD
ncbi:MULTISPECIES: hypothetical protein [Paraburkholderia]|uniref:Uncharacterized protein n=2 Tax=Paraburkholderia TaxID=1822464 RepID=A0A7Z0BAV9_9BURK|nr:hypothetical protein [Paraburkholderia bryophila]NYH27799.1 hypothetical protein [Paraburkholderia bryophila]